MIKCLLAAGANVNIPADDWSPFLRLGVPPPIVIAAQTSNADALQALIDAGADVNKPFTQSTKQTPSSF